MSTAKPLLVERSDGPWARAGACSCIGPRPTNEDVHVLLCNGLPGGPAPELKAAGLPGLFDDLPEVVSGPSLPTAESAGVDCFFAVFDGHGGPAAAQHCAERIPTEIREELEACGRDTEEARRIAVESTYRALDRHLRIKMGPAARDCGSCCIFCYAWLEEGSGKTRLLIANLGDSRGLVLRASGGEKKPVRYELAVETSDHSPDAPEEEKRIVAAGGVVEKSPGSRFAVPRVDGILGCSRSLGDFRFKEDAALLPGRQKVSIEPEVYEFSCGAGDVVVLGCDGVFDVLSSARVLEIVSKALDESSDPGAAAEAVVKAAIEDPQQQDNVTCVVALITSSC